MNFDKYFPGSFDRHCDKCICPKCEITKECNLCCCNDKKLARMTYNSCPWYTDWLTPMISKETKEEKIKYINFLLNKEDSYE